MSDTGTEALLAPAAPADNAAAAAATDTPNPATPAPAGEKWWGGFEDETVRGFAETKNWKSPQDAVKSYQNLEKIVGAKANALVLPGDDANQDDWNAFYDKVGRPATPDAYTIPDTLKEDEAMKAFLPVAHHLGFTAKQMEGVTQFLASNAEASAVSSAAAMSAKSEEDMAALRAEHQGIKFDAFMEHSRRAMRTLGMGKEDLVNLESKLGTKGMMTLLGNIGASYGETPYIDGEERSNGVMSPEAARIEIDQLRKDQNWMKAWAQGDSDKVAKMNKLHKFASGIKESA
ncbi:MULTISPECIES: hypothetical protein [unclassified Achromobacter]|uniref:hypothetical protein n=1 Tax=unclassified Achromobacter TaxID=2626865 RepID=UPI000B5199E8|nr:MULTISPECIES: hypothetical protein [unclassified Achromobacter]OWT68083.1 hypothetical protein CEY05_29045 [Achromobacter sp. HZ34]OWT69920.1 hypothetical protein CEY04_27875 [Achromobacter sp. HZ28]